MSSSSSEENPKIIASSNKLLLAGVIDVNPSSMKPLSTNYPTPATKPNSEK